MSPIGDAYPAPFGDDIGGEDVAKDVNQRNIPGVVRTHSRSRAKSLVYCEKKRDNEAAVFNGSREVYMVVQRKSITWGEVPKSLISLVLGFLATIAVLLVLTSLIVDPIDISGGIIQEVQGRISIVFIGMIAGFGLGMASWLVGCEAFPSNKSQPHWKMCRVCASMGIAFGILAMLIYLVFISLLPALLPLPK